MNKKITEIKTDDLIAKLQLCNIFVMECSIKLLKAQLPKIKYGISQFIFDVRSDKMRFPGTSYFHHVEK